MNLSVQTEIARSDGSLFADLGTMYWPNVDQEIVDWLAGSCKRTAFWLIGLPEAHGEDTFTLFYRTIVTDAAGETISDTTLLKFEHLSYADIVRFERWALDQLRELLVIFSMKHTTTAGYVSQKRGKLRAVFGLLRQFLQSPSQAR